LTITDWDSQYQKILNAFGYSRRKDRQAALLLNSLLKKPISLSRLKKLISGKPVFVVGTGPSLETSIPVLKKHNKIVKICADTALTPLLHHGIIPQIIVTDLDGDLTSLRRVAKKCIFIVHAHGDNVGQLEFVKYFKNCIGTTQTEEIGRICNFGGFTDGDRCVFLAEHFGASKIFMFGMDFGPKIGRHSKTKKSERRTKLKKLRYAKMLLEWLAPKSHAELFTLSRQLKGFQKIAYAQLDSKT
jgi:uncharacterized Rossmann fold enzyme